MGELQAICPRLPNGSCLLAVLDLDAVEAGAEIAVRAYADALLCVARAWGWRVLVEETGGRGLHLWFPMEDPAPANGLAARLSELTRVTGAPGPGVRVERLPASEEEPDLHAQAITLPLGVHVETGVRSRLRWADGTQVGADLCGLLAYGPNPTHLFAVVAGAACPGGEAAAPAVASPVPAVPDFAAFDATVGRVMAGCAVLRHLAEKARSVGHLTHAERLSFLYSLGHLGEPGQQAIHAVISACADYDPKETTRQFGKLGGLPIGCTRLRSKHATAELRPLCVCDFGAVNLRGGYPTPLLHAGRFHRQWRSILRGRREAEAAKPDPRAAGIAAVQEEVVVPPVGPSSPDQETELDLADPGSAGGVLTCIPPHRWA